METMDSHQNSPILKLIEMTIRLVEQVEEKNYYRTLSLEEKIRKLEQENLFLHERLEVSKQAGEPIPDDF